MIKVTDNTIIYVLCPAYFKTGGTELLHQLVFELNNQGRNAYITYYDYNNNVDYTDNSFKKYIKDYRLVTDIKDNKNNIIIFPEAYCGNIDIYLNSKKVMWWLSVDNYLKSHGVINPIKLNGYRTFIKRLISNDISFSNKNIYKMDYHLCQSYYAIKFLKKKKKIKEISYLSDYINDIYFDIKFKEKINKEDIVLYNPKKGIKFTKKIIARSPELNWIPIENLTNDQVRDLLLRSKVYIDFGHHPGKDRFPREAAISNCCVITSKNGSAYYQEDVPILEKYKFEDKKKNISHIIECIKCCLENYDIEIEQFEKYRAFIKSEKSEFGKSVSEIFK